MSPRAIKLARAVGFRHDAVRDAYVLRLVGNRIGPVLRTRPPRDSTRVAMEWRPEVPAERRARGERRKRNEPVERERRGGQDRRRPLIA